MGHLRRVALVLAGGGLATLLDGTEIRYNRTELRQPMGVVAAGPALHAELLVALAAGQTHPPMTTVGRP